MQCYSICSNCLDITDYCAAKFTQKVSLFKRAWWPSAWQKQTWEQCRDLGSAPALSEHLCGLEATHLASRMLPCCTW